MPVFEDYSKNGELLQVRIEPLNATNFTRYIKIDGDKKAVGYIEGLEQHLKSINGCLNYTKGNSSLRTTPSICRRDASKLFQDLAHFVEFAKMHVSNLESHNDNEGSQVSLPQDYVENKGVTMPWNDIVTINNFDQYFKVSGVEMAKGYIDVSEDIMNQLDNCNSYSKDNYTFRDTPTNVQHKIRELYNERHDFLEFAISEVKKQGITLDRMLIGPKYG